MNHEKIIANASKDIPFYNLDGRTMDAVFKALKEVSQKTQEQMRNDFKKIFRKHIDFNYGKPGHGFLIKSGGGAFILIEELKSKLKEKKE